MALVVEDGTGLAAANAYISEAYADTYHGDRGNTKWTDEDVADKEIAIIKATDYVDKRFGPLFKGRKGSSTQALSWPRTSALDYNGFSLNGIVPVPLQKAVAEYALRAILNNVLAPDPALPVPQQNHVTGSTVSSDVITGEITELTEKVGPITENKKYRTISQTSGGASDRSSQSSLLEDWHIPEYPEADMWMEELTRQTMSLAVGRG